MRMVVFSAVLLMLASGAQAQDARSLDDFESTDGWKVVASDQVGGALRVVDGAEGRAVCLDYDFHGVSGYVGLQKRMPLDYPENYAFEYRMRGEGPPNDLQFKLVDASGDNVWWVRTPMFEPPTDWQPVQLRKRHVSMAWGPSEDKTLRRSELLEFTLASGQGGKGSACFDSLAFRALPPPDTSPLVGTLGAREGGYVHDLGKPREFGGAILRWAGRRAVGDYRVAISLYGRDWRAVRSVRGSNGGEDYIDLPELEARYLRITPANNAAPKLASIEVQPLEFAATTNDFLKAVAARAPRGSYPRGFHGEQPYWTIVGNDGGIGQGLIGEDGAIELGRGAPAIEPFVVSDSRLHSWADVETTQSLQDGYLPMPSVHWTHPQFRLDVTAFAAEQGKAASLHGVYTLTNTSGQARDYVLVLALRPFQVNPPSQFLSTTGGVSAVREVAIAGNRLQADAHTLQLSQPGAAAIASTFDRGGIVETLRARDWKQPAGGSDAGINDPEGLASGAVLYPLRLQPGESRSIDWRSLLYGPKESALPTGQAAALQAGVADAWRDKLDRVRIRVPAQGQRVVDTLRTSLAHMLISRIGPRLQPGTRSYARAWIRDGAMINEGLLRLGREDVAGDFLRWYAPYQFDNGKVPCCVDDRGSDPVPENDSHGELIFNIAEYYRYTGDKAFLKKMWPHVQGAFAYMEALRLSERTEANRAVNAAFYGMMPASISHEGYSAKPMHSYWDNFWALRGYKDAVEVAEALGEAAAAKRMAASRDQFRDDLYASLRAATQLHGIHYLPGAAEIGDFDPTSTTIALAPGGEQGQLPADLLHGTFERYWTEFVQRRDGQREWKDYTPYEWRNVAAFVRLGWRERAWEVLDFFFKDRAPQPWNQWAEVVSRTPRKPFFVGDLPHAWVASDFVRSALDMFAYTREADDSLVLAAGVPTGWLKGEGIAIDGLRTPNGVLGYALRKQGDEVVLDAKGGLKLPAGGLVLPWPYEAAPGETRINGKPASWKDGELRITTLPAKVSIRMP